MKIEKYKVVVRHKLTQVIVDESQIYALADSWISACITRDAFKKEYNPEGFEVKILEV